MTEALIVASLFLILAVLLVPLAHRFNLGSVLGYLIAGALIGGILTSIAPMLGFETSHLLTQLNHASEFGVVLMLFLIGLEIQPSQLWKMKSTILSAGGLQVTVTAVLIMLVAMSVFDLVWQMGLAIGLTLALSSTAIIMSTLSEKGWQNTLGGKASFAALLFQDIAVIPIIAIIPLLVVSSPETAESLSHGMNVTANLPTTLKPVVVIAAIVLVYVLSRFLVNPLFDYIARAKQKEIFTTAAIGLVTSIAALMSVFGLSPALGVFVAGVILSESEYRHELQADIEPFKGLLLGIFFMTVGAAFNFGLFAQHYLLMASLTLGLIALKALVLYVVGVILKLKKIEHALFFLALAQGGEFAFVLLTLAVDQSVIDTSIADTLRIVVALSMAMTPLLFLFYEKVLLNRMLQTNDDNKRSADNIDEANKVIIAGVGRFGQIVGRLLQYNNFKVTALDNDPNMIDTLRKYGWKVFYGDATRMDLLKAAGIDTASAMVIAMNDPDKVIELTQYLIKHHPHLTLFVRARGRTTAYHLHHLGVKHIYRETFESSATLGEDVMKHLGMRAYQAKRAKLRYQQEDEALVKQLADSYFEEDEKGYVLKVQERIANLSKVLANDQHIYQYHKNQDTAWDETSLVEDLGKKED